MAKQNQKNELKYTGLTYESIKSQFEATISGDPRFENFTDSSMYKLMSDLFIGATDMTNYYIERQAEESYLDTAQHLSSVILNANQIGYVVRRPLGSQANISLTVNGPLVNANTGSTLAVSRYTTFNYNGLPYILTFAYEHTLTADEASTITQPNSSITFDAAVVTNAAGVNETVKIKVLQGEVKTIQILPGANAGKKFQKYNISDPEFSNYYGDEDLGGGDVLVPDSNLTRVFINDASNPTLNDPDNEFHINRRSLTAEQYTIDAINNISDTNEVISEPIKTCLLRTNKDTSIDLYFGDGITTAIGANTGQVISLQYFAVQGESVNATGLASKPLELNGNVFLDSVNINANTKFEFISNLLGGANIEDKDSIKVNAPAIFQSLDRLVTKDDYKAFIKTIVTPLQIKYGVVWGESDEAKRQGVTAILALFNAVMLSGMGEMYKYQNSTWSHKDILFDTSAYSGNQTGAAGDPSEDYDSTFVEGYDDMNSNTNLMNQAYFDLYIKTGIVNYMSYIYNDTNAPTNVKTFLKQIYKRSQVTIKNIYIPPIVQGFELQGDIFIKEFADVAVLQTDIQNTLYKQLNTVLQFETPVYISQITDLINSFEDVKYSNVKLVPIDVDDTAKMTTISASIISNSGNYAAGVVTAIETAATLALTNYLSADVTVVTDRDIDIYEVIGVDKTDDGTIDWYSQLKTQWRVKGFDERGFYDNFAKPLYIATSGTAFNGTDSIPYGDSVDFKLFVNKVNMMMKETLRNSMLDENGNIVNYSFGNEIPFIINKTTVKHTS